MTGSLSPELWQRVGELFHQALALPPGERTRFVKNIVDITPEVAREVEALIESDRQAGAELIADQVRKGAAAYSAAAAPERAGPYRLIREIGRGGMGTVYLGQRDDDQYSIQAAVKMVSPGMDTDFVLHRFRRERQTLANLRHPNIARLLDGGSTADGTPYIVMEFVDGPPITEYCRAKRLTIDQRLAMFLDVCAAVDHAHRNFIVHRDLKPGNILIDSSGAPKLLDFGICHVLNPGEATASATAETVRIMTPDYASPEQMRGERVTIASDVYSLGAVLYELLAEARPHRFDSFTLREMERVICEVDPAAPSSVARDPAASRSLRGELDCIVLQAMHKDAGRRYQTAAFLAEDIRRFQQHLPVSAAPDTFWYRTGKLVRRHSVALAVGLTVLAGLSVALGDAIYQARLAEERFQQVRQLATTFVFEVDDAVRPLVGSTKARELILATATRYLDTLAARSSGSAEIQAELAGSYIRLAKHRGENQGKRDDQLRDLTKARQLLDAAERESKGNDTVRRQRFALEFESAAALDAARDRPGALATFQRAASIGESLAGAFPAEDEIRRQLARTYWSIGNTYRNTGEPAKALVAVRKALEILNASPGAAQPDAGLAFLRASCTSELGVNEILVGEEQQGLAHLRDAAVRLDALYGQFPNNTDYSHQAMLTWAHIADLYVARKDHTAAEESLSHSVTIARALRDGDSLNQRAAADYGIALSKLAVVIPENQPLRRIPVLRESNSILDTAVQKNPGEVLPAIFLAFNELRLGDAQSASGDPLAAEKSWTGAMSHAAPLAATGQLSPAEVYVSACRNLGRAAASRGNLKLASDYAERAWNMGGPQGAFAKNRTPAQQRLAAAKAMGAVGEIRLKMGDIAAAREWLEKSAAEWRALSGEKGFNPAYNRTIGEVESALALLRAGKRR